MGTYTATWEDEENNRTVEFTVNYRIVDNAAEITHVTPAGISFRCAKSGEVKRTIRIHTAAGRAMVAGQIHRSERLGRLADEIAATRLASVL